MPPTTLNSEEPFKIICMISTYKAAFSVFHDCESNYPYSSKSRWGSYTRMKE